MKKPAAFRFVTSEDCPREVIGIVAHGKFELFVMPDGKTTMLVTQPPALIAWWKIADEGTTS